MTSHSRCLKTLLGTNLILAAGAAASLADVQPNAAMLRYPDVSATQIVFCYANDLWIVPRTGGVAAPLASPPGQESFPRFSADGQTIAFVGNYDGNRDVYTIGVGGGVPARVTHHPAPEILSDWGPNNSDLIYITNGFAGLGRQSQLWTSPAGGGLPQKLPVPYAGFGSISPDGTWLAYTPHSTDTRTWKRYRGGMATDVWLFNLKDNSSRRITSWEGTDTLPMWVPGGDGKVVYYLSDDGPEHRLNIWAFDVASGQRTQVTSFSDNDVRWPSIGPGTGGKGEVVFQLGSKLMLLDLGTKQSTQVTVTVPGDRPRIRTRTVDAARNIMSAAVSPSAKRVVVEARGDLWSAPTKEGVTRALTRTDNIAERDPVWSPDSKWIAYFSDETGEYQLWIRPTDAKEPEAKKEGEEAKDEKKEEMKAEAPAPAPEPAREPRRLSNLGSGFRFNPTWSPDSKWIVFTDENGRLYLTDVEKSETKEIDKDPWMNQLGVSWSSDSQWITYAKADDKNSLSCIWIANVKTGAKQQVTSSMFNSYSPAFDRKGEYLFFASNRSIEAPDYADLDTTFIYANTSVMLMVPLRNDVKSPWLAKSDEEELKKDEKKDEAKKDDAEKKNGEKKEGDAAIADDGVTGTWSGTATGNEPPFNQGLPFTLVLKMDKDGKVTGSLSHQGGGGTVSGTYDKATGQLSLALDVDGEPGTMTGTLKDGEGKGAWTAGEQRGEWTAKRSATGASKDDKAVAKKDDKEKPKEVKIDLDGFEARAIQLPIRPGNFGNIVVADGEKLIYARTGIRGEGKSGIKIYEYKADEKEEKDVVAMGGFQLSADGKKLMVMRGASISICDAAAGGGKTLTVATDSMKRPLDPRAEWKQIFTDAWRLQRDYFYEPTLHHVDWPKMREHYGAMIDDAASKEDVNWIIAEMISELNIGHAYLTAPGDVEDQPTVGVGLLGCDFELDKSGGGGAAPAYKIKRIIRGAAWDTDAVGPLSQPGVDVKGGDYLLAVNGMPVDATRDPWAAFVGTVDKVIELTVNATPTTDGKERRVLVKPIGSESTLRYRDYIESKRKYVEEKSGGRMGYIYVPNTGRDGQSDLFRQFFGQRHMDALIIDERWNGGGQIPTRFIELLNRPVTNYWARRDGNDWPWPPDAHFGPKAMLVNGLAGSGGDDFPWLFKYNKLGKVIGTRTWGGLVGISGNPRFVDGGSISVPTFGFYEKDGTWGVEGHGVDPDIEVIDDPALMVNGGDPQLDAAINQLNDELKTNAYKVPTRPASPDRSKMGIAPQDK